MGFHAVLDTCLALLNHFPLFALMLRIKEPHRLPGRLKNGSCIMTRTEIISGGIQFKTATTLDSLVIEVGIVHVRFKNIKPVFC